MRVSRSFRELLVGLGALVVAMIAVVAVVWVNIGYMEAADRADREAREELAQLDAVLEAIVDQETGLRGFVLTGNEGFLGSYRDSTRRQNVAMTRLKTLAMDDSAQLRAKIERVASLSKSWSDNIATPELAAARGGARTGQFQDLHKQQIDAIKSDIAAVEEVERHLLRQRERAQELAFGRSRMALLIGTGLALVFVGLIGGRSFNQQVQARRAVEKSNAMLKEALDRAQAAERAKTLFLANMSHEMRTPLNGVMGMADALMSTGLAPHQRELTGIIRSSADTLNGLIEDLLTLSREDAASDIHWAFGLGDLLRGAVEPYRREAAAKGIEFSVDLELEAERTVLGDAARLGQLLGCLIANAVKFTDSGRISVRLRTLAEDNYRFEVSDTGVGFDEARKAQLFQTFAQSDESATRKHGGAGLGLALARKFANVLGADLDATSVIGTGSTFTVEITLPSAAPPESQVTDTSIVTAASSPDDEPLRILIVDDNPTNRKVLELILEQLGVEWLSVENGVEAVAAAKTQAFAVILMDIQMPVMDGITATREIRRFETDTGRAQTPVIIVSANGQPEHVQAGRAAGAQHHLGKPVSAQALVDALNDVMTETAEAA